METLETKGGGVDGNTIHPPIKKERSNQLKNWFFTWNNYPGEWETILLPVFNICEKYSVQPEIGASGTPHLQGCLTLKKAMRWTELNLPREIHWEATRNSAAAQAYCAKSETRAGPTMSKGMPRDLRLISILLPWQQKCLDICSSEPDFRTVFWIWESVGNVGKSQFARYMHATRRALVVRGGEAKDLLYIVNTTEDLDTITTVIWDLPRAIAGHVSWNAIEQIKDGLITNTKYESGSRVVPPMHVVIFSNFPPANRGDISADRLKVFSIVTQDLVPE